MYFTCLWYPSSASVRSLLAGGCQHIRFCGWGSEWYEVEGGEEGAHEEEEEEEEEMDAEEVEFEVLLEGQRAGVERV